MAIDRRVERTRTALYDALVRLIRERPYDEISVQEILEAANVGRSTFYAHFTSKDDLLARSLDRLKALLTAVAAEEESARGDPREEARAVSRALFTHIADHRDIQLALAGGRGEPIVRNAINRAVASAVRGLPLEAPPGLPRELAVEFVVSTFGTVLRWWLDRHPELAPAEADALLLRLVDKGLGPA